MSKPESFNNGEWFGWQCAYASGPAHPYILPYNEWARLSGYKGYCGHNLFKFYRSEKAAMKALDKAKERSKANKDVPWFIFAWDLLFSKDFHG